MTESETEGFIENTVRLTNMIQLATYAGFNGEYYQEQDQISFYSSKLHAPVVYLPPLPLLTIHKGEDGIFLFLPFAILWK